MQRRRVSVNIGGAEPGGNDLGAAARMGRAVEFVPRRGRATSAVAVQPSTKRTCSARRAIRFGDAAAAIAVLAATSTRLDAAWKTQ
jgi:hypothetical protein